MVGFFDGQLEEACIYYSKVRHLGYWISLLSTHGEEVCRCGVRGKLRLKMTEEPFSITASLRLVNPQ